MTDEFKKGDKVMWSSHGQDDTPAVGPQAPLTGRPAVLPAATA